MNLRLSLKQEWFDKTGMEDKTEDYREITPYWCRRLLKFYPDRFIVKVNVHGAYMDVCNELSSIDGRCPDVAQRILDFYGMGLKNFTHNVMTLGYPNKNDASRIKKFEHAGIEIREGREEWGAEKGKIYFVIKHGKQIK